MLQADIFFFIIACLFSLRLSFRRPRSSVRTRFYLRPRSRFMFSIPPKLLVKLEIIDFEIFLKVSGLER